MKLTSQTRSKISASIKKVHATGRKMDGSKAAYSKSSPVLSSLDGIGRTSLADAEHDHLLVFSKESDSGQRQSRLGKFWGAVKHAAGAPVRGAKAVGRRVKKAAGTVRNTVGAVKKTAKAVNKTANTVNRVAGTVGKISNAVKRSAVGRAAGAVWRGIKRVGSFVKKGIKRVGSFVKKNKSNAK